MAPYWLLRQWYWPAVSLAAQVAWHIARWKNRPDPFEAGGQAAAAPAALAEWVQQRGGKDLQVFLVPGAPDELEAGSFPRRGGPAIFLSQAMADLLSPAELQAVAAHELAHLKLRHTGKTFLAAAALDAAGLAAAIGALLWAQGAGGYGAAAAWAIPLVILAWGTCRMLLELPARAYLRRQELAADREAIQITGDPQAFASAWRKLAAAKGADGPRTTRIRRLMALTPPLPRRLALAEGRRRPLPQAQAGPTRDEEAPTR